MLWVFLKLTFLHKNFWQFLRCFWTTLDHLLSKHLAIWSLVLLNVLLFNWQPCVEFPVISKVNDHIVWLLFVQFHLVDYSQLINFFQVLLCLQNLTDFLRFRLIFFSCEVNLYFWKHTQRFKVKQQSRALKFNPPPLHPLGYYQDPEPRVQ